MKQKNDTPENASQHSGTDCRLLESLVLKFFSFGFLFSGSKASTAPDSENVLSSSEGSDDDGADSEVLNQPCLVCGSLDDADSCLLCDRCDLATHYACVGLSSVPSGDWLCPWCQKNTKPTNREVTKQPSYSRENNNRNGNLEYYFNFAT